MSKGSIFRFAIWGLVLGCLCMAAFLIHVERPRSVPALGYVVDILGGGIAGVAVFSFLAWLNNLIAGPAGKRSKP